MKVVNSQLCREVRLTSPDGCCTGRCRSRTRRPQSPASGAAPQRSPSPGGTDATAATHSPAAAGRPGTPAGDGRGSRPSGHSAAGTGVLPGEEDTTSWKHHQSIVFTSFQGFIFCFSRTSVIIVTISCFTGLGIRDIASRSCDVY